MIKGYLLVKKHGFYEVKQVVLHEDTNMILR